MNLESFLQKQGIKYEKHTHAPTYTAQGLAQVEHVPGYMVAKPVIVKASSGFIMCVVPAPRRLSLNRVAEVLQDREVRLATEAEMAGLFPECELGAEPPVGAAFGLQTLMDSRLREDEYLVMQAGTHAEAIKMGRNDWEQICSPVVAEIAGV